MKTVFANKENFKMIVDQIGYIPSNLEISPLIEESKAIVIDNKYLYINNLNEIKEFE